MTPFPFLELLPELRGTVYLHLDLIDMIHLACTSRQMLCETKALVPVFPQGWREADIVHLSRVAALRDTIRFAILDLARSGMFSWKGVSVRTTLRLDSDGFFVSWWPPVGAWPSYHLTFGRRECWRLSKFNADADWGEVAQADCFLALPQPVRDEIRTFVENDARARPPMVE